MPIPALLVGQNYGLGAIIIITMFACPMFAANDLYMAGQPVSDFLMEINGAAFWLTSREINTVEHGIVNEELEPVPAIVYMHNRSWTYVVDGK